MLPDSESFIKIIPPSAWDEKANNSQLTGLTLKKKKLLAFASVIELPMPENTFLIPDKIASYMLGKTMLIKNN